VGIIWDPEKSKANIEKHGVSFRDAVPVLEDPRAITITDYESDPTEERFVMLGLDAVLPNPRGGLRLVRRRCTVDFRPPRYSQ
jgi:hypothetical protein